MSQRADVLTASFRVTTPMFLSGADQTQAELRLPSFKGALRFWWRALMWGQVQSMADLLKREAEIFGASDQRVGQSRVRLQLEECLLHSPLRAGEVFQNGQFQGAHYLGYGVMEAFASKKKGTKAGQLTRPLIPGGTFTLRLHLHASLEDRQRTEIERALILLGTLGGLGSKSRKGFGSLTLTAMARNGKAIELHAEPIQRLARVLTQVDHAQGLPEWTAWSQKSRLVRVSANANKAVELLDRIGREQVFYRSWGNNGKVLGQRREGNFKHDHDLAKGAPVGIAHPRRVVFGLPHNYGKKATEQVVPVGIGVDRRASPLIIHIHQVDDDSPAIGLIAFLPARFLPEPARLRSFGREVALDQTPELWQPIHGFLDRLIGKQNATARKTDIRGEEVSIDA